MWSFATSAMRCESEVQGAVITTDVWCEGRGRGLSRRSSPCTSVYQHRTGNPCHTTSPKRCVKGITGMCAVCWEGFGVKHRRRPHVRDAKGAEAAGSGRSVPLSPTKATFSPPFVDTQCPQVSPEGRTSAHTRTPAHLLSLYAPPLAWRPSAVLHARWLPPVLFFSHTLTHYHTLLLLRTALAAAHRVQCEGASFVRFRGNRTSIQMRPFRAALASRYSLARAASKESFRISG